MTCIDHRFEFIGELHMAINDAQFPRVSGFSTARMGIERHLKYFINNLGLPVQDFGSDHFIFASYEDDLSLSASSARLDYQGVDAGSGNGKSGHEGSSEDEDEEEFDEDEEEEFPEEGVDEDEEEGEQEDLEIDEDEFSGNGDEGEHNEEDEDLDEDQFEEDFDEEEEERDLDVEEDEDFDLDEEDEDFDEDEDDLDPDEDLLSPLSGPQIDTSSTKTYALGGKTKSQSDSPIVNYTQSPPDLELDIT